MFSFSLAQLNLKNLRLLPLNDSGCSHCLGAIGERGMCSCGKNRSAATRNTVRNIICYISDDDFFKISFRLDPQLRQTQNNVIGETYEIYLYRYLIPELLAHTPCFLKRKDSLEIDLQTLAELKELYTDPILLYIDRVDLEVCNLRCVQHLQLERFPVGSITFQTLIIGTNGEYNVKRVLRLVFMIVWTLMVMEEACFLHGDLHLNNIMVRPLPRPQTIYFCMNANKNIYARMENVTEIPVLFDFDRSVWGGNGQPNPSLRNYTVHMPCYRKFYGNDFRFSPRRDLLYFLHGMMISMPKIRLDVLEKALNSTTRMFPHQLLEYNYSKSPDWSDPYPIKILCDLCAAGPSETGIQVINNGSQPMNTDDEIVYSLLNPKNVIIPFWE